MRQVLYLDPSLGDLEPGSFLRWAPWVAITLGLGITVLVFSRQKRV